MMSNRTRPLRVGLLTLALAIANTPVAGAADFYTSNGATLGTMPTYVVLLNADLRTQIAYGSGRFDPAWQQIYVQNAINNSLAAVPGVSLGQAMAAGAVGGLIGGVLAAKGAELQAEAEVAPAHQLLHDAQCALPGGEEASAAVTAGLMTAPWASGISPRNTTLGKKQDVDDVVDGKAPRHVLAVSYSMTPDFSTVVTALKVDVYSDAMGGNKDRWASKPVRTERLVVASDQVWLEPKTQADIDEAIAAENARYATTPAKELIAKANSGDREARKDALKLQWRHDFLLRQAGMPDWTPTTSAVKRSQQWVAGDCQLLKSAIQANNAELQRMVAALYGNGLPPANIADPDKNPVNLLEPIEGEQDGLRATLALPGSVYLSRRGGDHAALAHLYTWYDP